MKKPWSEHFYIARHDETYVYLWYVKERGTKKKLKGGFISKESAVLYLDKTWQTLLNEQVENALLGL